MPGRLSNGHFDAILNLFQEGRIDCNLALAIGGSFDHRRVSAAHLSREVESWNVFKPGETEQIVLTSTS
jgi:hypothetical protein